MLTEFTTPGPALTVDDDATIYSLLTTRLESSAENAPLAQNKEADGSWSTMTAVEFNDHVRAIAKGLIQFGIGKGDAVSIFSATRIEWGLLDFALAAIGAVSVPIYDTDSAAQAQRILNDSAVKLAIADNQERFDRLDSVLDACPALERILMLDAHAVNALEGLGVMVSDEELDERIGSVHADDLATIVYTSGSTGTPKGAELTHRNFTSITRAAQNCVPEVITGEARLLLFLPLAHCFARMIQYFTIGSAEGVVGYLPNTKTLPRDMQTFQPTFLLGVPRVFEKVYNAASRKAGTGWKGRMFAKAAEAAINWSAMQQAGERPSAKQRAEHAMYETSVYRTIRSAFGPRIKYLASGGAPITLDLLHFFNGIGLTMIQGYGLTETAAPFTFTRVTDNKIGTVGQPVPGSSVRITPSGELEVRGQNVFVGYHHLPEKTAEVFTEDGWLRTGDLASIDDEGHITLTGRAKDIIITAGGKNVAPIPMEQEIAKCPIVEHAVVVGDNRPFVAAVVTLDPESLAQWLPTQKLAADLSLEEAAALPEVHAEIQRYVDRANADVSRAESVRRLLVLPVQFTQENKCLTPSMKVVRPKVNEVFAGEIDRGIYTGNSDRTITLMI